MTGIPYWGILLTVMLLAILAVIPTILFRKKIDLAVWIALLTLEGILAIGSGIFILTLGFFFR